MRHKILILLSLCLTLPACAGCDAEEKPDVSHELSSDSYVEETTEMVTEEEITDTLPALDFGLLPQTLDFAELAQSTVGRDYVHAVYDRFLASVAHDPEQVLHDGESGNYFRMLMSDAKGKRHNVVLEITHTEPQKWAYLLVSTENDFALIVRDAKKKSMYSVGFVDEGFVDQLGYTDESDVSFLTEMIEEQGYVTVLNRVRDEFFGQLSKMTEGNDAGYKLGFTGKIHNMWSEDKSMNPPEERDYTMSAIQLVNAEDISEVFTSMDTTYDITNDYLDILLGASEEHEDVGREAD